MKRVISAFFVFVSLYANASRCVVLTCPMQSRDAAHAYFSTRDILTLVLEQNMLNIYIGEPKADLGGDDDGFVEDALRCVDGLRLWIDGIIASRVQFRIK